jgi:hypothetical protein
VNKENTVPLTLNSRRDTQIFISKQLFDCNHEKFYKIEVKDFIGAYNVIWGRQNKNKH